MAEVVPFFVGCRCNDTKALVWAAYSVVKGGACELKADVVA